jgi:amino acid adenylation domain-containing protein
LVHRVVERAETEPAETALVFLHNGEGEGERITYGALDRRSRRIASHLRFQAGPGERALLLIPPSLDYVAAFLGCLYAGIVAVPAYPARNERGLPRIRSVARDAGATLALTPEDSLPRTRRALDGDGGVGNLRWVATEAAAEGGSDRFEPSGIGPETLAFLQYTSGSTADPKGVRVSQANLVHNQEAMARVMRSSPASTGVSWLPPFHDMGLIGGILHPLYMGFPCVLMSPAAFLQRPIRWLEAISRYRATISGGPDFAYGLCASKVAPEQLEGLDLRSWEVAFNGAEPVRAETMRRFAERFAPAGFELSRFLPCYGLAEATLIASAADTVAPPSVEVFAADRLAVHRAEPERNGDPTVELVGCGSPAHGFRLAVTDPDRCVRLPEGRVGEIWLAGPSVADGYWGKDEATAETFAARLRDTGEGPFLRTGDLGFLRDGELFVTGRRKELIILGGRNLYPQDVEHVVERSHPALRPHSGAAFSIEADGGERLVVVQELRPRAKADPEEILGAIREAVGDACEAPVYAVALVSAGSVPKTTSGKIMRRACRERYLAGELEGVAEWTAGCQEPAAEAVEEAASATAPRIEAWLTSRLAEVVGTAAERIDPTRPLTYYGLGSADAVGLLGEVAGRLGREVDPETVFDHPTLRDLARHLAGETPVVAAGSSPARGPSPEGEEIAIIGIACQFPGAEDPEALWDLVSLGGDAVTVAPEGHAARNGGGNEGGFLESLPELDVAVLGLTEEEAALVDPHHLRLLEVSRTVVERAGYRPERLAARRTGVYVGMGVSEYVRLASGSERAADPRLLAATMGSMAANRISHAFNWSGPSLTLDTACSSSLVALHAACEALRRGDVEVALVGGAQLLLDPATTRLYHAANALSAFRRCRTFDDTADGFVRAEGVAAVLLKPLGSAIKDGDAIWAVIKATAVNHDGGYKVGFGVPNPRAQRALLVRAYDGARVEPETIGLFEAHGSGTRLGDALELRALSDVFGTRTEKRGFCALGSVKSNLGHTEAASGLAGLIKAVLALYHRQLPPTLHLETPNRQVAFEATPFFLNDRLRAWPAGNGGRRAAVSAFGYGGTNAHVILEEAPDGQRSTTVRSGDCPKASSPPVLSTPTAVVMVSPAGPERAEVEAWLRDRVAAVLRRPVDEIGLETGFLDLGIDSVGAMRLIGSVEETLGERVSTLEVYEHPHIRSLAGLLQERFRQAGRELDARRPQVPAVSPGPKESEAPFPCTELQGAYRMARDLPAQLGGRGCRIYVEVDLPAVDAEALEEGFNRLVERHSMLRTVFPGDGTQRTLPEVRRYALRVEDLPELTGEAAEARCAEIRLELSRDDLDPARWPLFDVRAGRVDEAVTRIFLSLDMLQVDFLSFLVLMEEWRRFHDHPEAELPALPMDFSQYVEALAELRRGPRYREDREFWLARLDRFPDAPPLPLRSQPEGLTRPDFASVSRVLSAGTWARLQELATAHGVTPSAVLGTAYCRALAAWTGSGRFALNLPLFNRYPVAGCDEIDRLVGPFTTTVLLAVDLGADVDRGAGFWDQARRFHAGILEALEHRLFSGVELTRALLEHRRAGLAPVAPVVFTPALYRGKEDLWGDIRLALSQTAMVWLDCIALQDGPRLRLLWDFVEPLFDRSDLEARFERFVGELEALAGAEGAERAARAEAPAGPREARVGLEPEAERWSGWPFIPHRDWLRILEVNDTDAWYPRRPLHELVQLQTERDPDAPAIFDRDRRLSYRELSERSDQVAQALIHRGVARGSRVAVMMRRGAEPVVSLLGALKAGAAYVPVDPTYPLDRRLYTLRQCEPTVVLSRADVLAELSDAGDLPVLDIDGPEIARAPKEPVAVAVSPDDPAYLIYTSGSTGRPKGAVLTHGNAVNTIYDIGRRFGIGPRDRTLGFSSLGFDLSVFDLFGSLIHGAALVVLPEPSLREPGAWMELVLRHGVTVWSSVPTGMKMLLDLWEGRGEAAPSLRLVMLSGDWIPVDLPDRIRRRFPGAKVVGLGGPTECTIWQNAYPIGEVRPDWTSIPYGKPLANHRIYILDDDLRPLPVGEVGQMYVAGDGVGGGYWNDPEKTADAFFVHPVLHQRMYRSGDLGRYLPDMTLEILGRVDHQVKIRGFRIELGEIEAVLRSHAGIDQAVVVAWDDRLKEKRLAAFYTAPAPVQHEELAELLAHRLPDYMVPSHLEELPELPLNDNGKIDRKALVRRVAEPAGAPVAPEGGRERAAAPPSPTEPSPTEPSPTEPAASAPAGDAAAVDPNARAREVEAALLASWRELFAAEDLDPDDNFFELGGNSQLAVRAIRTASELLEVEVQVADLFSYPTIRKLSAALAARLPAAGALPVPAPEPPPEPDPSPLERPEVSPGELSAPPAGAAAAAEIDLEAPALDDALRAAYAARRSWRELDPHPVPFERLSRWLGSLRQLDLDGTPKYLWGSAGGLYPVQAFLQVRAGRIEGLDGGTYYVDPETGALVRVGDGEPAPGSHRVRNHRLAERAAFGLCLVGELAAIRPLYGDRSHHLCLLEAGLMAQVLEDAAVGQRIGFCQVAGMDAERLGEDLDLGPDRPLLHALLGGGLSAEQVARAAADAASVEAPAAAPPPGAAELRAPRPAASSAGPAVPASSNPYAGLPIPQGVELYDPEERNAFKARQHGVRRDLRDLRDRPTVALEDGGLRPDLRARYALRRSWRHFAPDPVPRRAMGSFLGRLRRLHLGGAPKYRWASAGGCYPVRVYLHVQPGRVEGLEGGLYRYRPEAHRLIPVCADPSVLGAHHHFPHNREMFERAPFSLFLVGDLAALAAAEPALAGPEVHRALCVIEAGLMTQVLDGEAAAGGIAFCHVGDMSFDPVAEVLGLGEGHAFLHSVVCGVPDPEARRRAESEGERLTVPGAAERLRSRRTLARGPNGNGSSAACAGAPEAVSRPAGRYGHDVAVVGMAGRFPRAETVERFWELLRSGTDLITEIPPERWAVSRWFDPDPDRPGTTYARWGAFLEGIEEFDPLFFKLSPAEARVMDSQQRLLLELTWETLERAGYAGGRLAGSSTGVFVGSSYSHHREMLGDRPVDAYMGIGSHNALIANRLSYVFDLHGPSLTVDTLCSSSLVALHLACQSLRRGESEYALVGAAQAEISPRYYEALSRLRALSPTGRCHTFDRWADGFVPGEGAGMVLLEPLERALEVGDHVLGVIRGTAVNHGGHSGGLTVPTPIAQAALIRTALDEAGIDAGTIGYVESHGTGTSLGDPIEIDGLTRAFREDTARSQYCAIGSLKTNLGHLEPAAGVGSLIKVLLALEASELPPTLHVEEPNPEILFEGTPFYIVDRPRPWAGNGHPRRAGISGFGMGGANAHVIVEEAPPRAEPVRETERPVHLLALSARSEDSLRELSRRFAAHLELHSEADLGDCAFTANTGRALFPHRLAVAAADARQAAAALAAFSRGERADGLLAGHVAGRERPRPVFLFAGQGAQKPGAGRELYRTQPVFRRAVERCAEILEPELDRPLLDLLLHDGAETAALLERTVYTQPALFALEYGLAETWRSWGVEPAAVLGHSLGEYVAACVAGVFSLEDGLRLVAERARLMQELPEGGGMAAISASEEVVRSVLEETRGAVVVAAVNGPESTVVSGDREAVDAAARALEALGVRAVPLRVSHAFHSPRMDPILDRFEAAAARIEPAVPRVPLVSNLFGRPFAPAETPDARYWRRHVREAVRFGPGLAALAKDGQRLFLEIGPGAALTGLGRKALGGDARFLVSLAGGSNDWGALLRSLGTLFALGSPVDWDGFDAGYARRRVVLPTTPFERTRCWLDPAPARAVAVLTRPTPALASDAPLLGRRLPQEPGSSTIRFERCVVAGDEPLADQHRVLGAAVLPGAAQVEMMAEAGRNLLGEGTLVIEDLTFTAPLAVGDSGARTVRLELEGAQGVLTCRIVSRLAGGRDGAEPPVEHARARITVRTGSPAPPAPAREPEGRGPATIDPERLYARAREMGIDYGPLYRSIRELSVGEGCATARLEAPSTGAAYRIEPGLLDGAFQALGALFALESETGGDGEGGLFLPFTIRELVVHRQVQGPVEVVVRRDQSSQGGRVARGDVRLVAPDGELLAQVTGLAVRPAPGGEVKRRPDSLEGWEHRRVWRPVATAEPGRRTLGPGTWLLAADDGGIAAALARRLGARGLLCRSARPGAAYGPTAEGGFTVRPTEAADWELLISDLAAEGEPLRGIVHLWGAGAPEGPPTSVEELRGRISRHVESLASLVRTVPRSGSGLELWLVTRAAEGVDLGDGGESAPPVPDRAAALGLMRVVRQEVPWLTCRCLDLPASGGSPEGFAEVIEDALLLEAPPAEAAWRAGGLWVPDLEPVRETAPVGELPDRAVVWITGGLGDLGLEVARALSRARSGAGAPRLVLQSRTPLPPRDAWPGHLASGDVGLARRLATIQELEAAGALVWPVAADVADPEAMDRLVREIEARWGTPFAIVHAAGVVRDGFLRSKDLGTFREVLRPKVEGGWVVDRLARERGIERLVLFSSVVAVAGNPGQGDYAAANAHLDALAQARVAEGLSGASLGWGPWSEVGMAARAGIDVRALGVEPIPTAVGQGLALRALTGIDGHRLLFRRVEPARRAEAPACAPIAVAREGAGSTAGGAPPAGGDLRGRLEDHLAAELGTVLGMAPQQIDRQTNFMELGFDSLMAVKLQGALAEASGVRLDPTLLFEHPSIRELAEHLAAEHAEAFERMLGGRAAEPTGRPEVVEAGGLAPALPDPPAPVFPPPAERLRGASPAVDRTGREVAVVGLACRFPGAGTPEAFWELIRGGTDAITEVPPERWDWRATFDPAGGRPGTSRSRWGGFLDRIDGFDPGFFGLSPREAKFMDPQQRLFLEVVWESLERAGYRPEQLAHGRTGVFVGIAASEYSRVLREGGAGLDPHMGSGSVLSMVPNRVSYLFDWKGPSLAVDTACSSSLVALDLACRCLRDGEAEMAVAGGSNLILTPDAAVVFSQAGMLSGKGRCMTFDDRADGYVRGEGVAAVLLKPFDRALADGDDVWAVIREVVVNHDGHSKASLTAPNPKAQRELLLAAYERAGVSPESVGLLEAHGTGTAMGDPIEIRGLTEAFRRHTDRSGFCAIGSVKSNVGHLEPAAGMAGLLKAILALRYRELPPTLHVEAPNRKIAFEETPFYVADRLRPWPAGDTPRRAGVSSFGFGGVNAHAVLEEGLRAAAEAPGGQRGADRPVHLFKLSARTPEALRRLAGAHAEHLRRRPELALVDLCFTTNVGRSDFEHRAAFVVEERGQLQDRLAKLAAGEEPAGRGDEELGAMLADLPPEGVEALRAWCAGARVPAELAPWLGGGPGGDGRPAAPVAGAALAPGLWRPVLTALAGLYLRGFTVDWEAVDRGFTRRRVLLPTYPFERRVCWCGERAPRAADAEPAGVEIETYLRERAAAILELEAEEVSPEADLITLGLESVSMMELVAAVKRDFGLTLYPGEILQRPSIRQLASYLEAELASGAVRSGAVVDAPAVAPRSPSSTAAPATGTLPAPSAGPTRGAKPPAVFLLSSPRSGSTLLRVMLAGHPELFCPPELHLLGYPTLGERERTLGASYLDEGLQRALMELDGLDAAAGARLVAELTERDLLVADVYRMLRERAAGRILVDKSPSYASNLRTVLRAEDLFEGPRYLGLARRPEAVVESFVRKRMHRLLGLDGDPFEIAEEVWCRSYRNLLELRARLGSERVHLIRYEDLVRTPEPVMHEVCSFLGVPFDSAVLTPYRGNRMTDGVHPESMAIGDPDFHHHQGIDASLADAWKTVKLPRPLGGETRRLLVELGYAASDAAGGGPEPPGRFGEVLVPLRATGRRPPLFCFHPAGGQVLVYRDLAERLRADQPVWALQSRALDESATEHPTLAAMAADYAARIRQIQPAGEPYRLLGWSMGGHLALAAAAELEAAGEKVAFLGLWDSRRPGPGGDNSDGGPLRAIASAFGGAIGVAVARLEPPARDALVRELSELGAEERIRRAVEWARDRGVLSTAVPSDALVAQAALVETHVSLIRSHQQRPVRAPIHVWWARDDLSRRPTTDWSRLTGAGVHTSVVDGDHFTMVRGAGLERLAGELDGILERLAVEEPAGAGRVA